MNHTHANTHQQTGAPTTKPPTTTPNSHASLVRHQPTENTSAKRAGAHPRRVAGTATRNHMLAALAKGVGGQTTVRQFGSMATPQDVPHGTLVGWGCRCTCCSAAGPAPAKSLEDIRRVLTDAARKPPDRPTGS
jgi:hypothetical protein